MILSNYSFLFENEGKFFIFNALSKAFLEIDNDSFTILLEKQKSKSQLLENEIDSDLYEELKRRLFICDNHKDEFLTFKSIISQVREQTNLLNLTIAPTMDCCFSCFYCFEKDKDKSYMTSDVIDAIIKNINKRRDLRFIHVTWFGGEPLMAIDKMQEFYCKFRPTFKGAFSSNIITTAHHINERVIDILKEIEVSYMQITIDGIEKTHNSIKFTEGCDSAFKKVFSSIDMLVNKYPELSIAIRVNVTKDNADEYVELYNLVTNKYNRNKVFISPSPVMNRTNNKNITNLFNHSSFPKYALDLWHNNKIISAWLMYKDSEHVECAIRNRNSLSVDPKGNLYQCWENIGNKKYVIGRLNTDGDIVDINTTVLNRNLYGADPLSNQQCIKCSYLPLCGGGCPIQRIQNEFEAGKNEICTTYKNNIKEWLTTYLEIKKMGYFGRPKEETSHSES